MEWFFLAIRVGFVLILINFYFRYKTFRSLERDLEKMNWKNLSKEKYIRKCYDFVAERFIKLDKCWLRYPLRNMYLRNVWKFKGRSVPCLIQNKLFQKCLLKRFKASEVKTKLIKHFRKGIYLHYYSRVKLNEKWIDVDVWGKRWGIPFGKNIRSVEIK